MPKANKKQKNASKRGPQQSTSKPLTLAEEQQTYGIVIKALGDRHFTVNCQDGRPRLCHVRGKMKNRQFVREGDTVLVTLREFADATGDIIDIYSADNVRILRKTGDLTIVGAEPLGESKDALEDVVFDADEFDFSSI